MSLMEAIAPNLVSGVANFGSSLITNYFNRKAAASAQQKANEFAQAERMAAQRYNSLENQFAQMSHVGMNPNLLTGESFNTSQPVGNQPFSTPEMQTPQFPLETTSQAVKNLAEGKKSNAEALTIDELRDGQKKYQDAQITWTIADKDLKEAQTNEANKRMEMIPTQIESLKQTILESDARTQNIREDTAKMRASKDLWRKMAEKQYDALVKDIAKTDAERQFFIAQKGYYLTQAENVKFNTEMNRRQFPLLLKSAYWDNEAKQYRASQEQVRLNIFKTQNALSQLELGNYETFGSFERGLGVASQGIQLLDQLISISPAERAKKDVISIFGGNSGNSYNSTNYPSVGSPYGSGSFSVTQ